MGNSCSPGCLSLVVSLIASFVLSFFPLDVLDEIWDLIESVSEGFLTYSCSLKTILSTDWSSDKNFEKFYCRESLKKNQMSYVDAVFQK